jgi:hypothetical protein
MSIRSSVAAFLVAAVAGIGALLVAAANDQRTTAFSLDVPNLSQVAQLFPGVRACQGPFAAQATFQGVRAWISPAGAPQVLVSVYDRQGKSLAVGRIRTEPGVAGPYSWRLNAPVPAGTQVSACLRNLGPGPVGLSGWTASASAGSLRVGSKTTASAAAMVLLGPHPTTLLADISMLFARAALFKASWVGAWTFWALCALIVAGFGLAAWGIVRAVAQETSSEAASPEGSLPATSEGSLQQG